MIDTYPTKTPMAVTAENLAKKYGFSRIQVDQYALQSQQRWAAGNPRLHSFSLLPALALS